MASAKIKYYQVSFRYPLYDGPYESESDNKLSKEFNYCWDWDIKIEKMLKEAKIDFLHAYSWSDGSCYKFIRGEDQIEKLKLMNFGEAEMGQIIEERPDKDPFKSGCKTLEDFFKNRSTSHEA